MSAMRLRGRMMEISDLHCGHSKRLEEAGRRGESRSATQSRRQDSCAVSAHGQGVRHAEVVGVSSVSSEKQIQHFRGSGGGCEVGGQLRMPCEGEGEDEGEDVGCVKLVQRERVGGEVDGC